MSKVFISIDWKAFRKLPPSLIPVWLYGWTNCDPAGIFSYDEEYARIDLKRKVTVTEFYKMVEFGVFEIAENTFLFTDFIRVNYVALKRDYNPHKPVFRSLDKYGLMLNSNNTEVDLHSFNQASSKLEGEREDEEEEEDKKEAPKKLFEDEVAYPWNSDQFKTEWDGWKVYKKSQHKFLYKTVPTEQAALNQLKTLAGGKEAEAILIIQQSIANGWKGFFELKTPPKNILQIQQQEQPITSHPSIKPFDQIKAKYENL